MNKNGTIIGIIGGIGFGLLLGSGYPGSTTTLLGAVATVAALGSMVLISIRKK